MARPDFGYYPNAGKCWLVMKPDKEEITRSIEKTFPPVPRSQGVTLLHVMSNSQAGLSS